MIFAWLNAHRRPGGGGAVRDPAAVRSTFTLLFRLVRRKSNADGGDRGDHGGGGGLVDSLAGAAAPVHAAVPGAFLSRWSACGKDARDLRACRYLALLPVATILWTNLHGGFFVGIVMIVAYGAGEVLRMLSSAADAKPRGRRGCRRGAISDRRWPAWRPAWSIRTPTTCTCTWSSTCAIRTSPQHIMEFLSLSFHHPMAIFFEPCWWLAVAAAVWNMSQGRFTEPLLLLVWAHGGAAGGAQHSDFHDRGGAAGGRGDQAVAADACRRLEVAGMAAQRRPRFNRLAAEIGETDAIAPLAPGQRARSGCWWRR